MSDTNHNKSVILLLISTNLYKYAVLLPVNTSSISASHSSLEKVSILTLIRKNHKTSKKFFCLFQKQFQTKVTSKLFIQKLILKHMFEKCLFSMIFYRMQA